MQLAVVETDSLECNTAVYERAMGEEIEYDFYCEICCEKCHSWINLDIRGYEYPAGAFNYSDYNCVGGEIVSEPTAEIKYVYEFNDAYCDYAYREYIKAESLLDQNEKQIKNMSSREFEFFVGDIFEKLGFSVKITQETRDGGCDIIATKAKPIPYTLIVECKHWGDNRKVDVSVVRSIYGVQMANQANQSVIVTSSKFTTEARKFAEERKNMMALLDIDDLLGLVAQ